MTFTIESAMPRQKYTESSFGERLQNLREYRCLGQVQLAEASFPPAPAEDDPEARRPWKRFQMIGTLLKCDQKAVVRLIHSLVAGSSLRKNTSAQTGDHHGR